MSASLGYLLLQVVGTLFAGVLQAFGFYEVGKNSGETQAQLAEASAVNDSARNAGIAYAAANTGDPAAYASLCDKFNF